MNMNGFRNITVAELQAMMEKGGLRLVDVRTDAEISRGKIPQGDAASAAFVAAAPGRDGQELRYGLLLPDGRAFRTGCGFCRGQRL